MPRKPRTAAGEANYDSAARQTHNHPASCWPRSGSIQFGFFRS